LHPDIAEYRKSKSAQYANRNARLLFRLLINIANPRKATDKTGQRIFALNPGSKPRVPWEDCPGPDVTIVKIELAAAVAVGVTVIGEKEQAAPAGRPDEQTSDTGFAKTPCAVDATFTV